MLILRNIAVVLLIGLLAQNAHAGDMYKWQDKDGVWHFSSTPPERDEKFDTVALPVEPRPLVTMRKLGTEREPEYLFINNIWGPVELQLSLPLAENVLAEPSLPASLVLDGQSEKRLLKIKAQDPAKGFTFRLAYKPMIGPPLAELPTEINYYPPFPLGEDFIISQGFDNDQTHKKPPNQYAVDIVMPIGTPVLAARAGRVMDMEDDFHGAGQSDRFLARSNQIRILHDDGTMAVYAHLQPNSLRVRPGGMVGTGKWIANSGNTGYSSGPHLHFVIQLNAGMSLESVPFRFYSPGGGTITPGKQMMISGVLPQKQ
jgi:murein DD-endopeptidase MepM/ murein hydrolase activator NlpD